MSLIILSFQIICYAIIQSHVTCIFFRLFYANLFFYIVYDTRLKIANLKYVSNLSRNTRGKQNHALAPTGESLDQG